jgi:hypothetical protein
VALLDLSLAFFERVFGSSKMASSAARELAYLRSTIGYEPGRHRTATGLLHKSLSDWGGDHPGWRLTLMDIEGPALAHDPVGLAKAMAKGSSPFAGLWEEVLDPLLDANRQAQVLVSLAYLSQVPATIELIAHLRHRGRRFFVGGSLPTSLAATGHGLEVLQSVLGPLELGDGSTLLDPGERLLDKLAYPHVIPPSAYFTSRPIVPVPLSTGCPWSRCLFCPDRGAPYTAVPMGAIENLLSTIPSEVLARHPVLHLTDSALPPQQLEGLLPLCEPSGLSFYGFARPTKALLRNDLVERAALAGCLMLQLGVESGSASLLARYEKGIDPAEARQVVRRAAQSGIRTYLYMLFGLPAETGEDRHATLDLLVQEADHVDFLNLSLFNLPRFCELAERAHEHDIRTGDYPMTGGIRLYTPFVTSHGNPRREARQFLAAHFRTHPKIRAAVLRTPRWLRPAHLGLMKLPGRSNLC